MDPLTKISDSSRQLLAGQQFSADGPGTIVRDFEVLIDFVSERGISTKSRQGNLPAEVLPELNSRLAAPLEMTLKRPLLRDYPNIGGVYVLLRVMDLLRIDGKRLLIDPAGLEFWRGLNATEKYFTLLETWLFYADASVLGGPDRRRPPQFADNLIFLLSLPKSTWRNFDEYCHLYVSGGGVSTWNTQLQMRLGLVEVVPRSLKVRQGDARGWLMEKARRSRWGDAVALTILAAGLVESEELQWMTDQPDDVEWGSLQPAFRQYFPDWKKVYRLPRASTLPGLYIFKVCFSDYRATHEVSCSLAVPGDASLHKVAMAVLRAFKFSDTEHLYEFGFRDRLGKSRAYFHPNTDEGPYANEVAVGDLGLTEKRTMKFLFDFGASWEFELHLLRVDPPVKANAPIKVFDPVGKAPSQYEE